MWKVELVGFNEAPALVPGKAWPTSWACRSMSYRFNEAPALVPGKAALEFLGRAGAL